MALPGHRTLQVFREPDVLTQDLHASVPKHDTVGNQRAARFFEPPTADERESFAQIKDQKHLLTGQTKLQDQLAMCR